VHRKSHGDNDDDTNLYFCDYHVVNSNLTIVVVVVIVIGDVSSSAIPNHVVGWIDHLYAAIAILTV
jgi:hypothetical protein